MIKNNHALTMPSCQMPKSISALCNIKTKGHKWYFSSLYAWTYAMAKKRAKIH